MSEDAQTQQQNGNQITEEYKQITEYPNYYVSNFGNVKQVINGEEKQLKIYDGKTKNFIYIKDENSKKNKPIQICRLVSQYFLEDFNPLQRVYHKDKDLKNNRIDNLYQNQIQEEIKQQKFKEKEYYGICFVQKSKMYKVQIYLNKKVFCFGYRKNILDALKLYNEKITQFNLQHRFKLNDIEKLEQKFKSN
ncbi:hypothetical protein ABPG74_005738 [Tetrahymena malaccensis]